jgi:rRNA processing protein Krr1/Pno1
VPEGLVSVTIGHKGKLIQKIKDETGISVVINQRLTGMNMRSTHSKGNPKDLAKACSIIYDTLEE